MRTVFGRISGNHVRLRDSALIGKGGEGDAYCINNVAYKIYSDTNTSKDKDQVNVHEAKLEALMRLADKMPGIAWPTDVLVDSITQELAGFQCPFVPGELQQNRLNDSSLTPLPLAERLDVAISICKTVQAAHAISGPQIILGDVLKAGNLLIDGTTATFIDCGSVCLLGFRGPDGSLCDEIPPLRTPGYTPLELLDSPTLLPSHATDQFALGVLLFGIIFERTPYDVKPCPAANGIDEDDAVREGLFIRYIDHPDLKPPTYDLTNVPTEIDEHFRAAFLGRAAQRPTAELWVQALIRWKNAIRQRITIRIPWKVVFRVFSRVAVLILGTLVTIFTWTTSYSPKTHEQNTRIQRSTESLPAKETPRRTLGTTLFREVF